MDRRFSFYLWLLSALKDKGLTLEEIKRKWINSSRNIEKKELTGRTFHRYRDNIATELGIFIGCNQSAGNVYYIEHTYQDNPKMKDWLLNSFKLSMLGHRLQNRSVVMLEDAPQDTTFLDDLLDAIDHKKYIKVDYLNPYGVRKIYTLIPLFVRLFKHRWYVIGKDKENHNNCILAVNRIILSEILDEMVSEEIKSVVPEQFFKDCYGIIKLDNSKAEKIRLRAFWPQYIFLEERPLHHSQQLVKDSGDGEYREYEIKVQPTFDLKQELLSNGRGLIVLSPEWFRQEMIATIKDMVSGYTTGKDYSGEGLGYDAEPE